MIEIIVKNFAKELQPYATAHPINNKVLHDCNAYLLVIKAWSSSTTMIQIGFHQHDDHTITLTRTGKINGNYLGWGKMLLTLKLANVYHGGIDVRRPDSIEMIRKYIMNSMETIDDEIEDQKHKFPKKKRSSNNN